MQLNILNVGDGDTKLTFDPKSEADRKNAATTINDLLRRGFAIMIEVGKDERGPLYRRADGFDPETFEYIIMGGPEIPPATDEPTQEPPVVSTGRKPRGKRSQQRVPAATTTSVAVSRTAGG